MRRNPTALLFLLAWSAPGLASAAPAALQLTSSSSCPSADDVVTELAPLLPHTRVTASTSATANNGVSARIEDEGDRVRIRVATEERVFQDAGRSCGERARTAAVFIGLVLDPPIFPETKPSPAPAPAVPPPAVVTHPTRQTTPLTLELGPLLEAAPVSDATQLPLAGGFGGRLAWGRALGVAVGAAFLLPTRLALPAADARLVWLPFDVSLRGTLQVGAVALAAELGPELALLFASGDRVKNPRTSTRLEVGARAALSLTWSMSSHLGAFVTLFGVWRPKPYSFRVNPGLESGTTPPVWLGASLGLSFRTR